MGDSVKVADSTVSRGFQTHIPKAIATALKLKLGDVLEWHVEGDEIKLRKGEGK